MTIETAAERAIFMDLAGFGTSVTVTPRGGLGAVTCSGIFDNSYLLVSPEGDGQVASLSPVVTLTADDLARLPRGAAYEGDTVLIGAATYEVTEVQPDGTGMVMLRLEKK
jgi:hypothetical protein